MPTEAIYEKLASASSPEEVKSILDGAKAKIVYDSEPGAPAGDQAIDESGDLGEDMKEIEAAAGAADSGPPMKADGEGKPPPFAKKKSLKDAKKDAIDKAMPEGM